MYVNKTTTTQWTETLLEVLYSGLKNQEQATVKSAASDLEEMGFPQSYLVQMVAQELGPGAAERLDRILQGKPVRTSAPAGSSVACARRQETPRGMFAGMLSRLRRSFEARISRH